MTSWERFMLSVVFGYVIGTVSSSVFVALCGAAR